MLMFTKWVELFLNISKEECELAVLFGSIDKTNFNEYICYY